MDECFEFLRGPHRPPTDHGDPRVIRQDRASPGPDPGPRGSRCHCPADFRPWRPSRTHGHCGSRVSLHSAGSRPFFPVAMCAALACLPYYDSACRGPVSARVTAPSRSRLSCEWDPSPITRPPQPLTRISHRLNPRLRGGAASPEAGRAEDYSGYENRGEDRKMRSEMPMDGLCLLEDDGVDTR